MGDNVGATVGFLTGGVVGLGVGLQVDASRQLKKSSREARARQEKANRVQKATVAVERSIKRRRAVAQARLAQQQNISEAANIGILGSSPLQGAQSSIAASLGTSFAGQTRQAVSGQQTFDLRQQAQNIESEGRRRAANRQAAGSFITQASFQAASFI